MTGKPVALFHIFVVFMISSAFVWAAETGKVHNETSKKRPRQAQSMVIMRRSPAAMI